MPAFPEGNADSLPQRAAAKGSSLARLTRQSLTQMLLLARVLGSGLGGVTSVQPALPFLLTGWTLAAAAQAQTSMINFQADSLNTTSFMVTWDDVAGDTYLVRYGEGDLPKPTRSSEFTAGTKPVSTKLHGGQREVRFIGLKKETQYTVYLRVQRSPSTNSFYEKLTVTTPATDPVINTKVENLMVQPRVAQLISTLDADGHRRGRLQEPQFRIRGWGCEAPWPSGALWQVCGESPVVACHPGTPAFAIG